jgi:hypothetical protein
MPAPSKCTNGCKAAILEALRSGCTRTGAAAAGKVSGETLRRWLLADKELLAEVEQAEAGAEHYYVEVIKKAAPQNWQAAAWWLERRLPQKFGRSDRLMVLRSLKKDVEGMTDEELYAVASGDRTGDQEALGGDGVEAPGPEA